MLEDKQIKEQLAELIDIINFEKCSEDTGQILTEIDKILNLYLKEIPNPQIRNFLKIYIYKLILKTTGKIEFDKVQDKIILGNLVIRKGAWNDGSEDENNINYYLSSNISKYSQGITCGNLKYESSFPNQVVELIETPPNSNQRARIIYRYFENILVKIEITSSKIAESIFLLEKKYYNEKDDLLRKESFYYEECFDENRELSEEQIVKKLHLEMK